MLMVADTALVAEHAKAGGMGIQNASESGMRASDAGPTLSIWAEKTTSKGLSWTYSWKSSAPPNTVVTSPYYPTHLKKELFLQNLSLPTA